jgi:cytochrome c biogenesis protein
MAPNTSPLRKIMTTLGSVKTGVFVLIVIGIVSAAGTIVLQRPITEPEQMQRAYSPQTLRVLDAIGLTDVFHAWWFIALMALFAICIICVSLERWPNAWRFYARPYRRPDSHFRRGTRNKREFPVLDSSKAIGAVERALQRMHLKPQRIAENNDVSLFAERARFSVFAVYIVHASILLILIGGILDGIYGFKGYLNLVAGTSSNKIEVRDRTERTLPFSVRCDDAGQENYPDGTPKKWWSDLAVVDNGREVFKKQIVVNDPLIYRGVRFYQSGFGRSEEVQELVLNATSQRAGANGSAATPVGAAAATRVVLNAKQPARIDENTTVQLVQLIPDFYIQDGEIFRRSNEMVNPALQLAVTSRGTNYKVWLFPEAQQAKNDSPYAFTIAGAKLANFTGLAVSHEPGQWAVWAGCVLMGCGMVLAFYTYHTRWWAQVVSDGQGGLTLWFGAAASKQREAFDQRFREVADEVEKELNAAEALATPAMVATAGK